MTAAIAEIIRNGVYFDVKNWGNRMSQKSDNFFERIALLSYVDGRNTQDIDLILNRRDLDSLAELEIQEEKRKI